MEITPKKLVLGESECFLCNDSSEKSNRVWVYGRSSLNIGELIQRAIDVDLSSFQNKSQIFVCRKCYKTLCKLQRLQGSVDELCSDIKKSFTASQSHVRVKRMPATQTEFQTLFTENAVKKCNLQPRLQPKSLQFTDNTSVHLPGVIVNGSVDTQPFQPTQSLPVVTATAPVVIAHPVIPLACSTPKSKRDRNQNVKDNNFDQCSTQVTLTVKYHSKTIKKELTGEFASLGKAIVHGSTPDPDKIARAVMKSDSLCNSVENLVLEKLSSQLNQLCARKKPSLLRQTDKDALLNFSLVKLCEEWKARAPLFFSFLMSCATNINNNNTKSKFCLPGVAVAGSVLLKQRNPQMCALGTVFGVMMKTRSAEVR